MHNENSYIRFIGFIKLIRISRRMRLITGSYATHVSALSFSKSCSERPQDVLFFPIVRSAQYSGSIARCLSTIHNRPATN